jgi:uncharacterized protein YndB with AHSA1/START domain
MSAVEPAPNDKVLVLTRTLAAPRSLVFKAWTEPEHLVRWWGPAGFTLPSCETDFRPGGEYRFCMRAPDGTDHWVWGEYLEITEPERLVFTWHRTDEPGLRQGLRNVVTVTLEDCAGRTRLTLHHESFQTVADHEGHRGGWTECLARLSAFVEQTAQLPAA